MQSFFARRLPRPKAIAIFLAGVGGTVAIAALLAIGNAVDIALVIAPFGASCVLIFGLPEGPLSQPANVVGGHMISAIAGMIAISLFPDFWFYPALGVGLAIAAMAAFRVTHPPAGANPVVIAGLDPGWWFLLIPVLAGTVLLVLCGVLYHRLTRKQYPAPG
ncbi:MAG: HPP family protein [Pseudomonadota bacterium]